MSKSMKVKRRAKARKYDDFNHWIYIVLKQLHPEISISKKSMLIMNEFCKDLFDRLGYEASRVTKHAKKVTLSGREVEAAAKIVLPGEIARYAVAEAAKAVARHSSV